MEQVSKGEGVLAETQFGIVLEFFPSDASEFWPRHNLELSQNNFDAMHLNFGSDRKFGIVF